MNHLQNSQ